MANKQVQSFDEYVGQIASVTSPSPTDNIIAYGNGKMKKYSFDKFGRELVQYNNVATSADFARIGEKLNNTTIQQGKGDRNKVGIEYTDYSTGGVKMFYIDRATQEKAGVMSADTIQTINFLSEYFYHIICLGKYSSEGEFLNALDERASTFDNSSIFVGTYENGISTNSFVLAQSGVGKLDVRQILFNKGKVFHRDLHYDEDNNLQMKEDWQFLFGDRLQWSTESHKYVLSQFGQGFNHNITDPVPLATSTVDGLMSKEDKGNFENMKVMIKALDARIAALESK